jgi:CHAT domain-containing protein
MHSGIRYVPLQIDETFINGAITWLLQVDEYNQEERRFRHHNPLSYLILDSWYRKLIEPLGLRSHAWSHKASFVTPEPTGQLCEPTEVGTTNMTQPKGSHKASFVAPEEYPRLIIAPAGVLHLLPLGLVREPKSKAYLSDMYDLTFVPSTAALQVALTQMALDEAKRQDSTSPNHQGTSYLDGCLAVAYPGEPGTPTYLKNAVPEAEAIAVLFQSVTSQSSELSIRAVETLYNEQAKPETVLAKANGQGVVHFSCHGMFNSQQPDQSGLALHGGFLTIPQVITQLKLKGTHMTSLSACQTNRTSLHGGEEHVGLMQSIMTAGTRSVVASLWSVPDEPTRILFEQFYKGLLAGQPPAQALRQAGQYVRSLPDCEHPFFWGAFQLNGIGE